ncbi:PREDICTED: phosphatidate phosphatase LPIN1 [Condylura cristata]|uniref:phosphatidate phosphatase LPIN1 n=1 Tax=Condylura cristata TaxID=143302 RepID=UPI0006434FEA|nr:PREDICTED: phosphatidate phosphatase LPIN1 [Condylura cristata]
MDEQDGSCSSSWEASRDKSSPESPWSWIPIMRDPGWIRNVWSSNINAQTMNYVGQLAGQVFVTVKELYKGLNPATLSGCIDIIVVRQPNGSLQCSPFHVRFGKMGVLRSREKVVDIEINGESVDLHMKLGDNGEAFFVQETDNDQEVIPIHLATSPILSEGASLMECQLKRNSVDRTRSLDSSTSVQVLPPSETSSSSSVVKKRRKRRRKSQLDSLKRDDTENTSEDEDVFPIEMSSDEETDPLDSSRDLSDRPPFPDEAPKEDLPPGRSYPQSASYPNSDREWTPNTSPLDCERTPPHLAVAMEGGLSSSCPPQPSHFLASESPSVSRPSTPKSDSELVSKSLDRPKNNLEMLWLWGELPQAAKGVWTGPVSVQTPAHDPEFPVPDAFSEQAVSYQQFVDNPALIDDPNLVVKIGNKYYNWTTAAPLLLAMQAFQKPLPKATVESIMRDKMPKKGGRWWFSWRGRNATIKEESKPERGLSGKSHSTGEQPAQLSLATRLKHESSSSDEEHTAAKPSSTGHLPLLPSVSYKKTLRLTSEQLKSLKLKNGPNDVVFSVTTQYQGTCRCEGTIYLWNWDDKVVISDIDGTITRSDTLGHILPTLGKDWTHQGIAKLYHKVSQNGYKFLYCSARAIGMADMTRGYLHWVNERGTVLPQGPLLLSPSSLFSALHREVIEKKPEKFKVQCLTDIKNLFFPNTEPFYAAFGNRPADVYSYKQVGVSLNRIFTVNPKGELVQEHAKTNISSYGRLCEVVDHVFPLLKRSHSSDFPCSDTFSNFTFWREPLPPFENQDVHSASA